MKHLLWASFALLAGGGLALGLRASPPAVVHVAVPAQQSPLQASRCPRHTLEDDGVCIPVPRMPGSPLAADRFRLPVAGRARVLPLRHAPVPSTFRSAAGRAPRALLIRSAPDSPVTCASALRDARVTELSDRVVLIAGQLANAAGDGDAGAGMSADGEITLAVAGLSTLDPALEVGAPCTAQTLLGTSSDAVVLFVVESPDAGADAVRLEHLLLPAAAPSPEAPSPKAPVPSSPAQGTSL